MGSRRVLDLSTIDPDRLTITVDGASYDMLQADDFGLLGLAHVNRLQTKLAAVLMDGHETTPDEIETIAEVLNEYAAMVLPSCPPEVFGKLRDTQKLSIVQAFQQAMTERGTPTSPTQAQTPTGAK